MGEYRSTFVDANSKSGTVSASFSKLLASGGRSPSESTMMGESTLNSPMIHQTTSPVPPVTTTNLCGLRPTAVYQVLGATPPITTACAPCRTSYRDNNVLEDLFASHSSQLPISLIQ